MNAEAPRRFYKSASVSEDAHGIMLDTRRLKTPAGAAFVTPTQKLAEEIAAEWQAQGEHIRPASMPLTQLAFAAIDHTPARRADLLTHVLKYAETDLLCHRADAPPGLVARQQAQWSGPLQWAHAFLGAELPVVTGIVAACVDPGEIAKLRAAAEALDDFQLTGLAHAVGLTGSAVLGFALLHGAITPAAAFEAAALDELWSLETWGEDSEARAKLDRLRTDIDALARYFAALA